jgi:hypothetical protein
MIAHTHQLQISQEDLAALGLQDIAYIRPIVHEGEEAFEIHGADGRTLALAASEDAATAIILRNDMTPVSLN